MLDWSGKLCGIVNRLNFYMMGIVGKDSDLIIYVLSHDFASMVSGMSVFVHSEEGGCCLGLIIS